MNAEKVKTMQVTLVKSLIGRIEKHKATVASLGLRRLHQTVELKDSPSVRGMLKQVAYLLKIEEV